MFQINNQVHENTINFLYQAATDILPKTNESLKLLKSYYINKTRDIARCENLNTPNKVYGPFAMCQKCSVPWGEGTCKVSIHSSKPKKSKQNKFVMVQKKKRNKKTLKKYAILNCTVCKNRTKQILSKPIVSETKPEIVRAPQLIKPTNQPSQVKAASSKKIKTKSSKKPTLSKSSIQKSKKPNQNHILQLAKLLSASTSRPTIRAHEDKLKHFLK